MTTGRINQVANQRIRRKMLLLQQIACDRTRPSPSWFFYNFTCKTNSTAILARRRIGQQQPVHQANTRGSPIARRSAGQINEHAFARRLPFASRLPGRTLRTVKLVHALRLFDALSSAPLSLVDSWPEAARSIARLTALAAGLSNIRQSSFFLLREIALSSRIKRGKIHSPHIYTTNKLAIVNLCALSLSSPLFAPFPRRCPGNCQLRLTP